MDFSNLCLYFFEIRHLQEKFGKHCSQVLKYVKTVKTSMLQPYFIFFKSMNPNPMNLKNGSLIFIIIVFIELMLYFIHCLIMLNFIKTVKTSMLHLGCVHLLIALSKGS